MLLTLAIGLDKDILKKISNIGVRCLEYAYIPHMYSLDGKLYVESRNIIGKWVEVSFVIWYGYFPEDNSVETMKAIALSNVPSFPDVRSTILHEDKAISLMLATGADSLEKDKEKMCRGWIPANACPLIPKNNVVKAGNSHCGQNKELTTTDVVPSCLPNIFEKGCIVEPFIAGESCRILIVKDKFWHISYQSDDWRKNINAKTTIKRLTKGTQLSIRAETIARNLGLSIAGIDFVGSDDDGWRLLEVNAYPGLDGIPEAQDEFINMFMSEVYLKEKK